MPLAYEALGAPADRTKQFLDEVAEHVAPERRPHFLATATLLLSVALVRSTSRILLERTEATVADEERQDPSNSVKLNPTPPHCDITASGGLPPPRTPQQIGQDYRAPRGRREAPPLGRGVRL